MNHCLSKSFSLLVLVDILDTNVVLIGCILYRRSPENEPDRLSMIWSSSEQFERKRKSSATASEPTYIVPICAPILENHFTGCLGNHEFSPLLQDSKLAKHWFIKLPGCSSGRGYEWDFWYFLTTHDHYLDGWSFYYSAQHQAR